MKLLVVSGERGAGRLVVWWRTALATELDILWTLLVWELFTGESGATGGAFVDVSGRTQMWGRAFLCSWRSLSQSQPPNCRGWPGTDPPPGWAGWNRDGRGVTYRTLGHGSYNIDWTTDLLAVGGTISKTMGYLATIYREQPLHSIYIRPAFKIFPRPCTSQKISVERVGARGRCRECAGGTDGIGMWRFTRWH